MRRSSSPAFFPSHRAAPFASVRPMEWLRDILQIVIGLGILNVWLLRRAKPSPYRGRGAGNLRDEFAAYGLSASTMAIVGAVKVALALSLLAGVAWTPLVFPGAAGMAAMMAAAVAMHVKVKDPPKRAAPAALLLLLSAAVAFMAPAP